MLSQCMSNSCLIHNIWILSTKVYDNDVGPEDEIKNILDDCALFPDVIDTKATAAHLVAGGDDGAMYWRELSAKRHHHRYQVGFHIRIWS